MRIWPLLLLIACAEPEPPPTEFEQRCMELVRDVLPDVHAVLGDSVGRPVRVREADVGLALALVPTESPGEIRVDREHMERSWRAAGLATRGAQDRELTLILAHELAHVYQFERQRWMIIRRRAILEDGWIRSMVPSEGHASYVSNEVARRRGWQPRYAPGVASSDFDHHLGDRRHRVPYFHRRMKIITEGTLEPYADGAAYIRWLVARHGHAGALRHLRRNMPVSDAEVIWPGEAADAVTRGRLRALLGSVWEELEVTAAPTRVLSPLLREDRKADPRRGWRIECRELHGVWSNTTVYLLPCADARAVVERGRSTMESISAGGDVIGARTTKMRGGFRSELLVAQSPNWRYEIWLAEGDWVAVLLGENIFGGPEWAEAWLRNLVRVAGGDENVRFVSTGWTARWQQLWEQVAPLGEDERARALLAHVEDPSEPFRALALATIPAFGLRDSKREALYGRVRKERAYLPRMALRHLLSRGGRDERPRGSHARALAESMLHDEDPFIRSGMFGEFDAPADEDSWSWYYRFALTDPVVWFRGDAVIGLEVWGLPGKDQEVDLAAPVPGRSTVESCLRELAEDDWHGDDALRILVRFGSVDPDLWPLLLKRLRGERGKSEYKKDAPELLLNCPLLGSRRTALEKLLEDEKLRAWAETALASVDE